MSLFVVSEHDQKYDRQTRIWGAHGQEAIEKSHICVIDAGPTSTETLKNLVLPNVGEFTLVDNRVVTKEDLGNNFFVDQESLGKPRAETVTRLLLEMNDGVKGHPVQKDPVELIEKDPTFFHKFNLVIACQLPESAYLKLGANLWEKKIPLLLVRSYGLLGWLRLSVPEVLVVESHYENDRTDMYIHPDQLQHFPELKEYCESFNIEDISDTRAHAHIPYIAILVHQLNKYRKAHGKIPSSYDETKEFKSQIVASAIDFGNEENFGEAVKFAYQVYKTPEIEDDVAEVLNHPKAENLTKDSPNFWILTKAVKDFTKSEGHGFLPVSAKIPDMTSLTASYVRLQEIFQKRAAKDVAAVAAHVAQILKQLGRPQDAIPAREVEYFVKNVRGLKQIQYRSLAQEYDSKSALKEQINEIFEEWEPEPASGLRPKDLHWYFALRAADRFQTKFGHWPGAGDFKSLEEDTTNLIKIGEELFHDIGITSQPVKECYQEIVRFGATEIHNTAAFMGGVASQVALKIILRQFIPLNNTMIHNGIHGRQSAFEV